METSGEYALRAGVSRAAVDLRRDVSPRDDYEIIRSFAASAFPPPLRALDSVARIVRQSTVAIALFRLFWACSHKITVAALPEFFEQGLVKCPLTVITPHRCGFQMGCCVRLDCGVARIVAQT